MICAAIVTRDDRVPTPCERVAFWRIRYATQPIEHKMPATVQNARMILAIVRRMRSGRWPNRNTQHQAGKQQ